MKYVIDTNALLNAPSLISVRDDIVITSMVLRELENLEKKGRDRSSLMYEIRNAKRAIIKAKESGKKIFDISEHKIDDEEFYKTGANYDRDYVDNILLSYVKKNDYGLISNDILLTLKAEEQNISVLGTMDALRDKSKKYKGYIVTEIEFDELFNIYADLSKNDWGLLNNQYLIIKDKDTNEIIDAFIWKDNEYGQGYLKSINSGSNNKLLWSCTNTYSRFTAKDVYQTLAMHSILNNQITMITGKAGSGKSMIGINMALQELKNGCKKADKIVFFFNPAPAKDAIELGLYKGTKDEKSMQSSIGGMLRSKLGEDNLSKLMADGKIELLPFVDLRGYSTPDDQKVIIYISEAQNLTVELLKLGLQRAGEDTKIIIDGDVDAQLDKDIYAYNNGMLRASEIFRGSDLYGEVELVNIYRSEIASIADQM